MTDQKIKDYYNIFFDEDKFVFNTFSKEILNLKYEDYNNTIFSPSDELLIHEFIVNNIQKEINGNKILALRIIGSYKCNACCKYCYQNKLSRTEFNNSLNFLHLFNFIIEYITYNTITGIQFFWYGGEALCYFEAIFEFILKLKKSLPQNINIYNDISTNAYFLNQSLIYKFNQIPNLSLSISFEPSEELQQKYRHLKKNNKRISYESLIENISYFSSLYRTTLVFILAGYNINALTRFPLIFNNKNIIQADIFIGKLTNINNCLADDLKLNLIRIDHFIKLRNQIYLNFKRSGYYVSPSRFNPFNTGCNYFVKNSFVILPTGNISKCHLHPTDTTHLLGSLKTVKKDNDFKDSFIECFKCKLLPICKGACVDRNIKKNRRACLMKNIDGLHFPKFPKEIISQSIKIMTTIKANKLL